MARLPDDTALGGLNAGLSGRPIATFDTTGYARGAEAIAKGARDIGAGLTSAGRDVALVAQQRQADDDKLELARAKSDFLTQKVELDASLNNDTDHETLPGRYSAKLEEIRLKSASLIRNPRLRELFDLSVADDVARGTAAADLQANKLWKDATIADANTRLENLRQSALKSADPEERKRLIQTGNDLITSLADKNVITRDSAVKTGQEWTTKYAAGAISMLAPEDRIRVLGGFEGVLTNRESGGKPSLVNQFGFAGLYQFGAPRLAALGVYKPGEGENLREWSKTGRDAAGKWTGSFDIPGHPEVRTISEFLASPDAQRAAFQLHSQKMDAEIKQNGFEKYIGQTIGGVTITREGLHAMMHLGGVGGAKDALEGKGNAKDANGTSILDYARLGNQSDLTRIAGLLPEDTRVRLLRESQTEVDRAQVKSAMERAETYERSIIDASAGVGTLPPRSAIEQDTAIDEPRRNALLRQYDIAAGDVAGLQRFMTKFKDPNAGAFNQFDSDDKKYADKAFSALGGDTAALQAVVSRTGILPKSAATALRSDLVSNDPKRVASALTLTTNMLTANPNVFTGMDGKTEFENNSIAFRHYVDDLGLSADEAAKRIIRDQSPEYQAGVKARIKSEDIDAKIKKELSISDLSGAFDQMPFVPFTDPKVGFDPRSRQEMFAQYAEQVKDRYLETGDMSLAKRQAADQLKRTWGVSNVNGSATVMQYPPERAPAYAGIEDVSGRFAQQAIEAVKAEAGVDVGRAGIRLLPIPGATATAYKSGQPVPYMLSWTDKNGVVQMLSPGRAFVADPAAMRESQTERRGSSFSRAQKIDELRQVEAEVTPATLQQHGFR